MGTRRPPDVNASVDFTANDPWWFRHTSFECVSIPFGLSLSKPRTFIYSDSSKEERPFDKLRANGMASKHSLRELLRAARRDCVAALDPATRALIMHRPPAPLLALVPGGATIGLYHASAHETPTGGYARFFHERGHALALPRFAQRGAPMEFAAHTDPWDDSDCEVGPFGLLQPTADAAAVTPDLLFVPLLGFTADGARLGQGGGHYDRWLAEHPGAPAIGLAWDVQLVDELPVETHDHSLAAVVTPTRLYGPFA